MKYIRILMIIIALVLCNVPLAITESSQKISINFTNIKVRDLLYLLTEHCGKSVVISDNIHGKTNIDLRNVSAQEALAVVLQTQGLVKQETEKVIIISCMTDKNESIQPATFNLRYASADNLAKLLAPTGALSQSGKAGAETRTNMLVVADTDNRINSIKNLLKQVDVPVKQVLIEARIVSADENFMRDLGVKFSTSQPSVLEKTNSMATTHSDRLSFSIAKLKNNAVLDLELAALESEGRGKVISSPKLLTADRQAAYIESGAEIPYQEKTKRGDTSVSFKKAVLSLQVTPEIASADAINLLLQLNQDKVSSLSINGVPAIDTRKIQTQVLVHNGETIVLGGIYEWSKSNYITSVPVLGKIPLLGLLFRKQETKMERKELLMFVTPLIIE